MAASTNDTPDKTTPDYDMDALSGLIERTVNDFDNIYDALVSKGIPNFTADNKSNGVIPTNLYASNISTHLVKVNGKTASQLALTDGMVNYLGNGSITNVSVNFETNSATFKGNISTAGYYSTDSNISVTVPAELVQVDTDVFNQFFTGETPTLIESTSSNSILKGITLNNDVLKIYANISSLSADKTNSLYSSSSTKYSINISAETSAGTKSAYGLSGGFIRYSDDINLNSETKTSTVYLKEGSAVISPSLTIENPVDTDDGLSAGTNIIFSNTQPTSGDYFKIISGGSLTTTAGVIDAGTTQASETLTKYLPKAKFAYVSNSSVGSFLQVTSGGYVPASVLSDIVEISGTPDYADVKAALVSTPIKSATTVPSGAYTIALSKNQTSTNSGYITGTQGKLSLDNNYYILKGSDYTDPTTLHIGGSIAQSVNSSTHEITFSFSNTSTAKVAIPEGYYSGANISKSISIDPTSVKLGAAYISESFATTLDVNSDFQVFTNASQVGEDSHVTLCSITGATALNDRTVETSGYIDNSSQVDTKTKVVGIDIIVPAFPTGSQHIYTIGDQTEPTDFTTAISGDELDTRYKFCEVNIQYKIGDFAMGAEVINKLKDLQNRLDGI